MQLVFIKKFVILINIVIITLLVNRVKCNNDDSEQFRLPNATIPKHYDIEINTKIDRDDFKFNGIVTIKIEAAESINEIILHSNKATKISKVVVLYNTIELNVINFTQNVINEFLTITLKDKLVKGEEYHVKISYKSKLRSDKLGFYRSSYINDNGKTMWLAATQFAPTQARHAFPCYDEPKFKATFKITITHPKDLNAISNSEVEQRTEKRKNSDGDVDDDDDDGDMITTTFKTTQIMSTYLVGFVISDFEKIELKSQSFNQAVYARKNSLNNTAFAAESSRSVLQKFMDYFHEKFPIDTMKHVPLPDFHYGGMENWGIVTYAEYKFMFDPKVHTSMQKVRTIALVSHEMGHSWFGNLVTMEWWTYVWMKEGFATMYGYYIADMVFPKEKISQLFFAKVFHFVFDIDDKDETRPMTHYVERQDQILSNYDRIAYEKSACVLRMMDHAFGHDVFKKAVDSYLNKHKFNTAKEDDLFKEIQNALPSNSDIEVSKIFKTWTSQKGYPVLTVIRDYSSSSLTISQERFLSNGDSDEFSIWHIPINFVIQNSKINNFSNTTPDIWITDRSQKITYKNLNINKWANSDWIILNKQQTGYYRINYDERNWQLISEALLKSYKEINVHNRAQLINDAFALAKAEKLNYSIAFNLIKYLKDEIEYSPWAAFQNNINELNSYLLGTTYHEKFSQFVRDITDQSLSIFGLENAKDDVALKKITRKIIVMIACGYGSEKCNPEKLSPKDPDMRSLYFCGRMRNNTNEFYLEMRKLLKITNDVSIRSDILSSFGCSTDETMLSLFLSSSIENPSDLKLSDKEKVQLFTGIYQGGITGLELSIKFLLNNWKSVNYIFPSGSLETILPDIARNIHTSKLLQLFKKLLDEIELKSSIIVSAKSQITRNVRWHLLHKEDLEELFNSTGHNNAGKKGLSGIIFLIIVSLIALQ